MASTSTRTLRLLTLLQAQRHWPGDALADRLGVSPRTLRRDVDRLRELGYPVSASRGTDGGYRLAAGAALPPLALDDEEAVALAVGLQAATASTASRLAEPSLRALAKVVQVMPPRLRRQVDALRAVTTTTSYGADVAGPDAGVLLAAAQACRSAEGLRLGYTAADGTTSTRRVDPHHLVRLGRRWYLVAHDVDRADWRTFRVDRIKTAVPDGRRFRPRALPGGDPGAHVRARLQAAPREHAVRAVLHCPVEVARQRLGPWAPLTPLGDDRCELLLQTESLSWTVQALGATGAELSGVEPPELLAALRDWSARLARAT